MGMLSSRTGVAPATIRYYLSLGLLPEPEEVAPNRFLYDERHVERVRLIRALRKGRRLSLEVIRLLLPDLEDAEGHPVPSQILDRVVTAQMRKLAHPSPRVRLLRVATEAFNRLGYAEVTVDELCGAAGLAKGSFYRYFPSKEALFCAVADDLAERLASQVHLELGPGGGRFSTDDAVAALRRAMSPHLALVLELVVRTLQKRSGFEPAGQRFLDTVAQAMSGGLGPGTDGTGRAGRRVVEAAVGASLGPLFEGQGGREDPPN
jgi:AcrR family transcriptional regulator